MMSYAMVEWTGNILKPFIVDIDYPLTEIADRKGIHWRALQEVLAWPEGQETYSVFYKGKLLAIYYPIKLRLP